MGNQGTSKNRYCATTAGGISQARATAKRDKRRADRNKAAPTGREEDDSITISSNKLSFYFNLLP
jgi:hypothetical protein